MKSMPLGSPRLRADDGSMNVVGERVRLRRKDLKIKQKDLLGKLAYVTEGKWNPTEQEVLRVEHGTRTVTDTEVLALALALDCEPQGLLLGNPSGPIRFQKPTSP